MTTTIEAGDWLYVLKSGIEGFFMAYVWEVKPDALHVEIWGQQFVIPLVGPEVADWEFWKVLP